jgi:hypothetical protein
MAEQQTARAITVNIRQPINIVISTCGWQEWLRRHPVVVVVVIVVVGGGGGGGGGGAGACAVR